MRINKKNIQGLFLLFLFLLLITSISFIIVKPESNNIDDNSVFLNAPEDSYEYNDQFDNATDIRFLEAQWLSSYLGNGSQWNEDWYMIDLDMNEERLKVELIFDHSVGNIDIEIYDSNYNYMGGNYSMDDNEYFEQDIFPNNYYGRDIFPSSIYYLRIFGDNAGNSYDLWWEDLPPYDDYMEENDDYLSAQWAESRYYRKLKIVPWDEDWFNLYLNNNTTIDIRILFDHFAGNLELELYDPSSIRQAERHSLNDNEFITSFTTNMSGFWRIRVYHADNNSDVFYELDIITGDDWREENDDFWSSYGLYPDYFEDLVIVDDDDDWFNLYLDSGDTIDISIFFNHNSGDLQLELYSENDYTTPRRRSISTDNDEFIYFSIDISGNWRIRVYHNQGNSRVHYDMDIWIYKGDDWLEPNDDFLNAVPVDPIEYYDLIILHENEDWFLFYLDIGDTIDVRIDFDNYWGNLELELYDPYNSTRIGSYSTYDSESISFTADIAGDWRIRVYHADADSDVYYSMEIWGDDQMEQNDDYWSAQSVENRNYKDLVIMGKDDDWFRIFLNSGDFIEIMIFFDHYEGNLQLELYNPNDYITPSRRSTTNNFEEFIEFTADISGDWLIHVYHDSGDSNVRYNLEIRINGTMLGDDPYEFNSYPEEAYDLSDDEGKWLSEIHGLAVQGDEDWYMIEIYPGFQHLMVNLTYNHTSYNFINIHLYRLWDEYNFDGDPIYSNYSITGNNTAVINFQNIDWGIYLIQVHGSSSDIKYDLWWEDFRTDSRIDDNYEENDDLSNAYDLSTHEYEELIWINNTAILRDNDWYKIQVPSGREFLIVLVKYDYQEGAIGIEIYNWAGSKVTSNFTQEDNEIITYEVPSNGTYYIRIFGERASRNIYTLSWYTTEPTEEMIPGYDIFILLGVIFGIGIVITLRWKRSRV